MGEDREGSVIEAKSEGTTRWDGRVRSTGAAAAAAATAAATANLPWQRSFRCFRGAHSICAHTRARVSRTLEVVVGSPLAPSVEIVVFLTDCPAAAQEGSAPQRTCACVTRAAAVCSGVARARAGTAGGGVYGLWGGPVETYKRGGGVPPCLCEPAGRRA